VKDAEFVRFRDLRQLPEAEEKEQIAVLVKAQRNGFWRPGEDMTAYPSEMPPPGGDWKKGKNISAPGTGKLFTLYIRDHHKIGRGPTGTDHNKPVKHSGVNSKNHQKTHAPTGTSNHKQHHAKKKATEDFLGAKSSDRLIKAAEGLRKVLDDKGANEKQIAARIKEGLAAAREAQLSGAGDDPKATAILQDVGKAINRIGEMRNAEFDALLKKEERSPGSVTDQQLKDGTKNVLDAERERQLLGAADTGGSSKAMDLVSKALNIYGDRKADAVRNLLAQEKRAPGSVPDARLKTAISDLLGATRQSELLGTQGKKQDNEMSVVGEVIRVLLKRKTEDRDKLIRQKTSGDDVSDQQIQQATDELNKMKEEARIFGITGS
jgi:hypothetical protein